MTPYVRLHKFSCQQHHVSGWIFSSGRYNRCFGAGTTVRHALMGCVGFMHLWKCRRLFHIAKTISSRADSSMYGTSAGSLLVVPQDVKDDNPLRFHVQASGASSKSCDPSSIRPTPLVLQLRSRGVCAILGGAERKWHKCLTPTWFHSYPDVALSWQASPQIVYIYGEGVHQG